MLISALGILAAARNFKSMKLRLLLILFLFPLASSLWGQPSNRRVMETNPEYLAWLERYGDSLSQDDRYPRMQPNPEYLKWLAQQEEQEREIEQLAGTSELPPVQYMPPTISEEEQQARLEAEAAANPNRPNKDIILGLAYTATAYYGDLNYSEDGLLGSEFVNFYPGLTLTLRRDAPRLVLPSFNIGYGRFVAQNPDLEPVIYRFNEQDTLIMPNTYAETDLIHGEVILLINPIRRRARVKPYLGIGIGATAFYPKAKDGILLFRKFSTRAPEERTYGTLAVTVPLSAGVYFNINQSLSVHVGYLYRFTSSDYLDNIGLLGQHPGNDQLHSFKLGLDFRIYDAGKYERLP